WVGEANIKVDNTEWKMTSCQSSCCEDVERKGRSRSPSWVPDDDKDLFRNEVKGPSRSRTASSRRRKYEALNGVAEEPDLEAEDIEESGHRLYDAPYHFNGTEV